MVKAVKVNAPAGKLAGQKVVFVGTFGYYGRSRPELEAIVKEEGGAVVDGERTAPDYLVEDGGGRGKPPAASAEIHKKHPAAVVLTVEEFFKLVVPTADEFAALLLRVYQGHEEWRRVESRIHFSGAKLDLTGADLRKFQPANANLHNVTLDDCDFRGATLIRANFGAVRGGRFDGARFTEGSFTKAEDCSLKNVEMDRTRWNPAEFVRCDFSGATLAIETGSFTRAMDCTFKKANFSRAELEQSHLSGCDFSGANLSHAKLQKADLAGAKLTGANCTGADLRNANLTNTNLRNASLCDANLIGADFTGANVEGADFTGANLTGAKADGLDTSKAKGFDHKPGRVAGPNMLELAKVAKQSKQVETSVELELPGQDRATISAGASSYGTSQYPHARYVHEQVARRHVLHSSTDAPTFEQGMLNLVDLWSKGAPRLDTVKARAKKCPLKPQALLELARAAWCEALGVPLPSADEWKTQEQQQRATADKRREQMLMDLRAGAAGVERFNARTDKAREALGSLRGLDLSDEKLAGARLNGFDLQAAKFDGAILSGASFSGAQLQGASFADVPARKAVFAHTNAADAVFRGSILANANMRGGTFARANFQNADLTGATFDFSDVRGADFTGATLKGASFAHTKFDAGTTFPAGFVPPENAAWTGTGAHPGKVVPEAALAKPGSIDFGAFLKGLAARIDPARVSKATAMLKAERFQLYADVTDAHLVGAVKSQSSAELVYSCKLTATGEFFCGTQNVRPCGGLQGALCKHLLVLVVGLAKAGKLDPAVADNWVAASRAHKPLLDKDALAETFLKYKGAEAGEVDWRPTETVPEDFYAM